MKKVVVAFALFASLLTAQSRAGENFNFGPARQGRGYGSEHNSLGGNPLNDLALPARQGRGYDGETSRGSQDAERTYDLNAPARDGRGY